MYNSHELEALKAMFETTGWGVLVREASSEIDAIKEAIASQASSMEQVAYLRGQRSILEVYAALEGVVETLEANEAQDDGDL